MYPVQRWLGWLAAAAALWTALPAAADPPARVGRLSLVEGEVTFRVSRQDGGSAATYNWPISSGAILDTGRNGRAEVQVGSSVMRLAPDSRAEFSAVDDERVVLQMARGSLAMTLRDRDQAEDIEVMTPAGQVGFGAAGRYRVDVDEGQGTTQVSVRDGSAYVYRSGGEMAIPAGHRGIVYGSGGWYLGDLYRDRFDDWADARDGAGDATQARRYVSPQMTGYEDLDRYGDWGNTADYGAVWYPREVDADWAPYRYGRWAWVPPWGWTWVDDSAWGFAPFHYGRWLYLGGRWAWVPGTYIARPVYAPALVAWVGGAGWSVSFGSGPAIGWFPLAPREVFVPAYRCSPAYIHRVNINHVTNVTVINRAAADPSRATAFANRAAPRAVTVVPAAVVRSGQAVTPARLVPTDRKEVARAPVVAKAPAGHWLAPAEAALRPRRNDARPLVQAQPAVASPGAATAPVAASPPPVTPSRQPPRLETSAPRSIPPAPTGQAGEAAIRHADSADAKPAAPLPEAPMPPRIRPEERRHEQPAPRPAPLRDLNPASLPSQRPAVPAVAESPSVPPAQRSRFEPPVARERGQESRPAFQAQPLPQPRVLAPAAPARPATVHEIPSRSESRPAPSRGTHDQGHERSKPPDAR